MAATAVNGAPVSVFKAFASASKGQPFEPITYEPEPLGPNDVEVRVTHNGLCHTDLHMRDNDWGNATYPLVAGHEVVGIVEDLGADVTHLTKGDRVAFGWIKNSCRSCVNCTRGEENICKKGYEGLILGTNKGGFQERLRASADFAYRIPDALDSVSAAPLMCAGITVYVPLRTHMKRPGMKVGVIGIGGLGHLAIQLAHKMGGIVTAFSTSPSKEEEARKFGAHDFVVIDPSGRTAIPEEKRVDLLINTAPVAPANDDYQPQFDMLCHDGTLVLVGIPAKSTASVSVLDLVFNQKKLAGSIVGGRLMINEMLEFCAAHNVKPLCQVMELSALNKAIEIVKENKARYRIVLVSEGST